MEEEIKLPKPELDLPLSEKKISANSSDPKFKIKPLHFFIGFVCLSFIFAFITGGFMLTKNSKSKETSPTPKITRAPTPTPSCTPRPACLDAIPACKMPETSDICPPSITPTKSNSNSNEKVCTQEAKQCPDGSWVSRTGPNCEFAKCP